MNKIFKLHLIIFQTFLIYTILSINSLMGIEKIYKGESLSRYFSGVVALSNNKYEKSYFFFKGLQNLENAHSKYSTSLLYSLVNNSKINEAYKYSNKLKFKNQNFFKSDLVVLSKLIKNNDFDNAHEYLKLIDKTNYTSLENLISQVINNWVNIEKSKFNFEQSKKTFNIDPRFKNINKINDVFLNCYYDTVNSDLQFQNLINNDTTDFSRYTYFYVDYLLKKNLKTRANLVLEKKLKKIPRNLLLNQLKTDIKKNNQKQLYNNFDCKNVSHIIAELFYITANALSSQEMYSHSNFYLNLAKYLNQDFISYNTLLAENFVMIGNYKNANQIYSVLENIGETYSWYSAKQKALIQIENEEIEKSLKVLEKNFKKVKNPDLYQIYDFANLLKNNEKFEKSIKYYSKVIGNISQSHELYPKAKDGRGIAFERTDNWQLAEKDFLDSLEAKPDQAYVINYLAYSWIEKGIKIEESLKMLKEANRLRSNDGYITDSLGWALYKLEKYDDAKIYLQKAVQLMPSDPIVNDHFADVLWMNGKKLQARYYWEYVLSLEETKEDLKNKINDKIINGPSLVN